MSPFSSGKCELRTKFWQINCKTLQKNHVGEGYKNSNDSEKSEKNAEG
jgi:hypothetical protein